MGTAGRKKISKCWLQETNDFLEIYCYLDLIHNYTEFYKWLLLVTLVSRSPHTAIVEGNAPARPQEHDDDFTEKILAVESIIFRQRLEAHFGALF